MILGIYVQKYSGFDSKRVIQILSKTNQTDNIQKQFALRVYCIKGHQCEELAKMISTGKFDADGSGALDIDELSELFLENDIGIDKETLKAMFNNQNFTLRNFKNINNSQNSLKCNIERAKVLNKKIMNKESSTFDLEKIINRNVENFASMILANNVQEQDLTNSDNALYFKLKQQSLKNHYLTQDARSPKQKQLDLYNEKVRKTSNIHNQSTIDNSLNQSIYEKNIMMQSIYDIGAQLDKHKISDIQVDLMGLTKKRFIVGKDVDQYVRKISDDAKLKAQQAVLDYRLTQEQSRSVLNDINKKSQSQKRMFSKASHYNSGMNFSFNDNKSRYSIKVLRRPLPNQDLQIHKSQVIIEQ
ncbi:UNKNOWN [Stylonychia lemnae]|uniref:EF-hand domain-containing protein n=1 Tax=Stylonychia lemnae TaxID=5949 RepID=A0A078AQ65_STYLE|nr:UNKNOWN [Stylonychia lemnae]|eukprot:CDW84530.1 UNKNOWN [Stylonychia lemnae]